MGLQVWLGTFILNKIYETGRHYATQNKPVIKRILA